MTDMREALDRTLLLMRDEVRAETSDATLMSALMATEIAISADPVTLASPAAQTAFVTIAMLGARSGHRVHLVAEDVRLAGPQPPLSGGRLISALMEADGCIVPARRFCRGAPVRAVDLEISLGSTAQTCDARARAAISATRWSASLTTSQARRAWEPELAWPMGAMAGADLAAAEAFKCAMAKLHAFARDKEVFAEFFCPLRNVTFELAPEATATGSDLGMFDLVSGGAITNGALYALSRLPDVRGRGRIVEPDRAEGSNLNRYMMTLTDDLGMNKAERLAVRDLGELVLSPQPWRFEGLESVGYLAPRVLVGVDHIPTRWAVQRAHPRWLGIGATTHWSAMASHHALGETCAGCAHPRDDLTDGPIPTVAFVSFMAALLQTTDFLRHLVGDSGGDQISYLTVPRANRLWRAPLAIHEACPVGHGHRRVG